MWRRSRRFLGVLKGFFVAVLVALSPGCGPRQIDYSRRIGNVPSSPEQTVEHKPEGAIQGVYLVGAEVESEDLTSPLGSVMVRLALVFENFSGRELDVVLHANSGRLLVNFGPGPNGHIDVQDAGAFECLDPVGASLIGCKKLKLRFEELPREHYRPLSASLAKVDVQLSFRTCETLGQHTGEEAATDWGSAIEATMEHVLLDKANWSSFWILTANKISPENRIAYHVDSGLVNLRFKLSLPRVNAAGERLIYRRLASGNISYPPSFNADYINLSSGLRGNAMLRVQCPGGSQP